MKVYRSVEAVIVTVAIAGSCLLGNWLLHHDVEKYSITSAQSIKFPSVGASGKELAYSSMRSESVAVQGLPVRLKIPAISVDALIEDAFLTSRGRMEAPSGIKNVAWYAAGTEPGQIGSAVIGGHYAYFDDNRGQSVFYDLNKLTVGDKVYVENDKGETIAFVVRKIEVFDRNADALSVFSSNDGMAHLNLITCEGVWNSADSTYPDRRVVFTDAVKDFDGVISGPKSTATFHRTLAIGSRGEDVKTLQTFLESKGFLTMPESSAKGYFGQLTRIALSKYQDSVGLPSVGVLGPLTRIRLIVE